MIVAVMEWWWVVVIVVAAGVMDGGEGRGDIHAMISSIRSKDAIG